jgi:hypothetical protein
VSNQLHAPDFEPPGERALSTLTAANWVGPRFRLDSAEMNIHATNIASKPNPRTPMCEDECRISETN